MKKNPKITEAERQRELENRIAEGKIQKDIEDSDIEAGIKAQTPEEKKEYLLSKYKVLQIKDNGKVAVNCPRLAKLLMESDERKYIVLKDNQEIYISNGSFYDPIGKGVLENRTGYYLGDLTTKRHKEEVVGFIKNYEYVDREELNPPENLINLQNGVYNRKTKKLLPHTDDIYFLNELPINYKKKAKIVKIKKFFGDLLNLEDIKIMKQFFGDCLQRTYKYKKALMCVGITNTGKSQVLGLLGKFLGDNNTSNVSLYQLCNDRFATVELYGQSANICADIGATSLKYTELFKIVTGGDRLRGQKKHKDSFEFRNYAKLIYSCNKIPDSEDKSNAYYGRWIPIEFSNQFDKETWNTDILMDITTEKELSGLFNWSIEGLEDLEKNNGYSEHRTLEDVKEFMQKGSNPISEFAVTHIELDPNGEITKGSLYSDYVDFCKFFGYPTKDDNVFSRKIKQYFPRGWDEGQSRKKGQKRTWRGIKSIYKKGKKITQKTTDIQQGLKIDEM